MAGMNLRRGDHVCAVYSTPSELADIVGDYIADGLEHRQRCWYVTPADDTSEVRAALARRGLDVDREIKRHALALISGDGTYVVHGSFDPELAIQTFNDAIEDAYSAGFTGFRAAAEMSWALGDAERSRRLIEYEALLRALFSNCRATGLCLYDRNRMPLNVIDGALTTHPIVHAGGRYGVNKFYDARVTQLSNAEDAAVLEKLDELAS